MSSYYLRPNTNQLIGTMVEHPPRIVAIELLKVDLKFGPEDKTEQLFTLSFSFKDDTPLKWEINLKFAAFQELHKLLSSSGVNYVTTDFPKAHRSRAAFGMKLSQEKLDQRRTILSLWFRELVANYDLVPEPIQKAIVEFIKVPPEFNLKFSTRDQIRADSPSPIEVSNTPVATGQAPARRPSSTTISSSSNPTRRPSSTRMNRNSFTLNGSSGGSAAMSEGEGTPMVRHERPKNNKVYKVHTLFLHLLELAEILSDSCAFLHTSNPINKVLCISRSEVVTKQVMKPIGRLFIEDLASVYFFGVYFSIITVLFASANHEDYYDGTIAVRLLYVSVISLCIMLFHDQYDLNARNIQIKQSNCPGYDPLQFSLNEFVHSTTCDVKYTEYLAPFSGLIVPARVEEISSDPVLTERCKNLFKSHSHGGALLKSFLNSNTFTLNRQKSRDISADPHIGELKFPPILSRSHSLEEGGAQGSAPTSSSSHNGGSTVSAAASVVSPSRVHSFSTDGELTEKESKEKAKSQRLAARKAFDEFEFPDLSPAAKAMFIDRRFSHNFNVRGVNYMTDKKKVHPGSAMCKLMLLELYEVESRDGDRHDHIAVRGMAKARREAIAALPGNPFQFIVNFQIPGDPPVSIVTYFAVPPDLAERFDPAEVETFQAMFGRFINIPSTEAERLATWGVVNSSSGGDDAGHTSGMESDGEDSTSRAAASAAATGNSKDTSNATSPGNTATPGGGGGGSSWMKMPSDISWPDPHEPGGLPQSDFRNARFKLIPAITEGPWVVKAAVRSQPALLGRKVVQRYFRGEGYMEVDIHVGSSVIASNIVGVCRGYGKAFAADVGIVIQGEDPSELPEKMLGCVSFNKIDVDVRHKLD